MLQFRKFRNKKKIPKKYASNHHHHHPLPSCHAHIFVVVVCELTHTHTRTHVTSHPSEWREEYLFSQKLGDGILVCICGIYAVIIITNAMAALHTHTQHLSIRSAQCALHLIAIKVNAAAASLRPHYYITYLMYIFFPIDIEIYQ